MNIRLTPYLGGLILLTAVSTITATSNPNTITWGTVTANRDTIIDVEIALTSIQRETGLMRRTHLDEHQGMLFVFPDEAQRGVWMKNTHISLDVVFLSAAGTIVDMQKNLQPCEQDPCAIYLSKTKAQYMLEINAGFIDDNNLKPGQQLIIDYPHPYRQNNTIKSVH